jgi:transposase
MRRPQTKEPIMSFTSDTILDAEGLLRVLAAYLAGDSQICSMVHVPTPDEEDGKRVHREREYLVQERTRIENRISALFVTQGIRSRPSLRSWERDMADLATSDGRKLPRHLAAELNRLCRRLVLVRDLICELDISAMNISPPRRAMRSPQRSQH